jgi:hypothetical protein
MQNCRDLHDKVEKARAIMPKHGGNTFGLATGLLSGASGAAGLSSFSRRKTSLWWRSICFDKLVVVPLQATFRNVPSDSDGIVHVVHSLPSAVLKTCEKYFQTQDLCRPDVFAAGTGRSKSRSLSESTTPCTSEPEADDREPLLDRWDPGLIGVASSRASFC